MSLIEILLLSIALGIDCLVVSFSQGLIFKTNRVKNSLMLALTMGIFQGLMPFIGYVGAHVVSDYVSGFADWIVFAIFLALGGKFIYEAITDKDDEDEVCAIGLKCLVTLGIATSIDAMGAGVSLSLLKANLFLSVFLIGLASFLMSLAGFWFGNCFKHFPSKYLEIGGGIILIGLAIKAII